MIVPRVFLAFEGQQRRFQPGESLAGNYLLEGPLLSEVKAVELSVLWYTEGKGDEDLAVHFFERCETAVGTVDFNRPHPFSTRLPTAPLSYTGIILRVRWCARVRVFLAHGKDLFIEEPFELGDVPAVHEVEG